MMPRATPCLVVPEEDSESLCDYLDSRGIVCRQQGPAETVAAEVSHRVTIAFAPEPTGSTSAP